jgi:hypothetical protein
VNLGESWKKRIKLILQMAKVLQVREKNVFGVFLGFVLSSTGCQKEEVGKEHAEGLIDSQWKGGVLTMKKHNFSIIHF